MASEAAIRLNPWPRVVVAPLWFWLGGMAGGAHLIGALQRGAGPEYAGALKWGSTAAFALVFLGALLLTLELSKPTRMWRLLVTLRPKSPLSIGAWVLTLFAAATFAAALSAHGGLPPRLGDLTTWTAALLAFPLMGYTGLLLVGSSRPIGSASILPGPLFLTLGLLSGAALHALASTWIPVHPALGTALRLLGGGAALLLLAWLGQVAWRRAGEPRLRLVLRGRLALGLYGGLLLGTLVPLLAPQPAAPLPAACALLGGLALRFVLFNADLEKR